MLNQKLSEVEEKKNYEIKITSKTVIKIIPLLKMILFVISILLFLVFAAIIFKKNQSNSLYENKSNVPVQKEKSSNSLNNNFDKSKIIKNSKDIQFITGYIKSIEGKDFYYNLIFQSSRDGDKAANFHKLCDNKSPLFIAIKTKDKYIFGGYTTINVNNKYKSYDNKSFCFNIDNKKIYKIKNGKYAINNGYNGKTLFSLGTGNPFGVYAQEGFLSHGYSSCYKKKCEFEGMEIEYEINNGNELYFIEELEIYEINFK